MGRGWKPLSQSVLGWHLQQLGEPVDEAVLQNSAEWLIRLNVQAGFPLTQECYSQFCCDLWAAESFIQPVLLDHWFGSSSSCRRTIREEIFFFLFQPTSGSFLSFGVNLLITHVFAESNKILTGRWAVAGSEKYASSLLPHPLLDSMTIHTQS